ncbi:hypothetical protein CONLIGDRAFT_628087 [Coniochaeta ligniaria NRRL 30616]|uniref:Nucleolar 27S pre-rRNA processing Urb2/Npa2 C-terminal domain-containing protein n=1 Tax=Coniochaeta ligniaria NRRL 30616 TaxID=1408157 RepID=A0A1J7IZL0_9PEZI|nr:hypothetical protein CONLIGDRAFT_628087 [Coniochaeta ligniaria NRRL 30616]
MAEQHNQPGELALVKAVRSLDQGGSEAIPDKLDQIWKILSIYTGGRFHAAEEMLVRWLLKNMNGSSDDAQKLRRYPLTWRILGKVFSSVPLFSLAKSLADRRFVHILQSALNDASQPKEVSEPKQSSDTEMVDVDSELARPRKKKRSDTVQFDMESQSGVDGCLRTAESLFEAVRLLLKRLEPTTSSEAKRDSHMGAEHIKSLFCSSAGDIKDLILPAFNACKLAVNNAENAELHDGQESWISTICGLWDLHLQGEGDAVQVATHLSPATISMLGKLTGLSHEPCTIDDEVKDRWAHDLERFLTRNLILPARTAFLNQETVEIIRSTADITSGFSTLSCPVIFDLVLDSPQLAGGQGAKRDNDSWIQAVFSLLDETLQSSKSKHKLMAVKHMMNMAYDNGVSLSLESLRSFCNGYALKSTKVEWLLLLLVAKLNPDAFIVGDGEALLQTVLDRLQSPDALADDALDDATQFIVSLAEGFAKARDLSGFVKRWYEHLVATEPHTKSRSRQYLLWYSEKLITAVAESLEKTMNTKQILSLLDWLESQGEGPAEDATLVLLFGALSQGISQEEVVDAVGTRLFDTTYRKQMSGSEKTEVLANKWTVARRSLQWSPLKQAEEIWSEQHSAVPSMNFIFKECPLSETFLFEAFKFAVAGWTGTEDGKEKAVYWTTEFLKRLDQGSGPSGGSLQQMVADYLVQGHPRLLSMVMELEPPLFPSFLKDALSYSPLEQCLEAKKARLAIFKNENNTNSQRTMDMLLSWICENNRNDRHYTHIDAEILLSIPLEAISREHREKLMGLLMPFMYAVTEVPDISKIEDLEPIASLMAKLMRKPTFYTSMTFRDIDRVAWAFAESDATFPLQYLPLVEELATLTARQMTTNMETRELEYLHDAVRDMQELHRSGTRVEAVLVFRVALLKVLIVAIYSHCTPDTLRNLKIDGLELRLTSLVEVVVREFCSSWQDTPALGSLLQSLSVVLDTTDDLEQYEFADELYAGLSRVIAPFIPRLRGASETLRSRGDVDVWSLRRFLTKRSDRDNRVLLDLGNTPAAMPDDGSNVLSGLQLSHKEGIVEYIDACVGDSDDRTRLDMAHTLLTEQSDASNRMAKLLAVQRIIQTLNGNAASLAKLAASEKDADLATIHTILCKRLRHAETPVEFLLISQILQTILDDRSYAMTQWNIELTLSTVSSLASQATTHKGISSTPKAYESLCRLVQVIVRRHRLRLEGHFHILVTVLQSLLRSLICHPYDVSGHTWPTGLIKDPSAFPRWAKHAKAFARLVTMVCEPTPGSVSRSQQASLDSATGAAKRYAGQHMYLVLMLYIKLQLEQNVPHAVREVLEPGVFAILDITTPEGRRIMNDALDGSGRAIMKELYKQYLKFGKWSGI